MAGKRRPMDVNLSVVDGGKHWTQEEINERQAAEVKMPKPKTLNPPTWLSDPGKKIFRKYAKQLLDFPSGIVSTLDVGTLARYCDCELSYAEASNHKNVWLEVCRRRLETLCKADGVAVPRDDIQRFADAYEEAKEQVDFWSGQMVKFEKIARGCATEMGMTVSSRCRLVVPKAEQKPDADPLAALQKKFLSG